MVGGAEVFLQGDALHVFLVFFLSEADASGLPLKRSHAERQRRSAECDMAPKRGTDTQQASGFGALSFWLGFLSVPSWDCCRCVLVVVIITVSIPALIRNVNSRFTRDPKIHDRERSR